jgi:hypothetical protein
MIDNSNHHRRGAGWFGGIDWNNTAGLLKEHIHTGFEIRPRVFIECLYAARR